MPRKLDPKIAEILKAHGFGPESCWECHGTWVVYHRVLERIAAKAGITFDQPFIIEANSGSGVAAMCVTGHLGEKTVWSVGEASSKNTKNQYPWAVAEKRAVDRVILKLIGLHSYAYSEEEAEEFVKRADPEPVWGGPLNKTDLQAQLRTFDTDLHACDTLDVLEALMHDSKTIRLLDQCKRDRPSWYYGNGNPDVPSIEERIRRVTEKLTKMEGVAA